MCLFNNLVISSYSDNCQKKKSSVRCVRLHYYNLCSIVTGRALYWISVMLQNKIALSQQTILYFYWENNYLVPRGKISFSATSEETVAQCQHPVHPLHQCANMVPVHIKLGQRTHGQPRSSPQQCYTYLCGSSHQQPLYIHEARLFSWSNVFLQTQGEQLIVIHIS